MVMYANEVKTRTLSQRRGGSLAWRLDREIGRRLILHETGFTRQRFFTSYFIDVDTFYRVLAMTENTSAVAGYTRV